MENLSFVYDRKEELKKAKDEYCKQLGIKVSMTQYITLILNKYLDKE